jgi:hypothetical protein
MLPLHALLPAQVIGYEAFRDWISYEDKKDTGSMECRLKSNMRDGMGGWVGVGRQANGEAWPGYRGLNGRMCLM